MLHTLTHPLTTNVCSKAQLNSFNYLDISYLLFSQPRHNNSFLTMGCAQDSATPRFAFLAVTLSKALFNSLSSAASQLKISRHTAPVRHLSGPWLEVQEITIEIYGVWVNLGEWLNYVYENENNKKDKGNLDLVWAKPEAMGIPSLARYYLMS